MKKGLIIFLVYTFLCCPVFANDHGMPTPWQMLMDRFESVILFTMQNFPDWIRDYTIPIKRSDVQANKKRREEIKESIRDAWDNPPFVY